MTLRAVAAAAFGAALASLVPSFAVADLISREIIFGNPERASVQISPDGSRLAFLAPRDGVLNVWMQTIGADDARPLTQATTRPIASYFWSPNGEQIIFAQDRGGDENFRLFAVSAPRPQPAGTAAAAGEPAEVALTPFDNVQSRVTAVDRNHPDEILVSVNNRDPMVHDVWRINTRTGVGEMIVRNDWGFAGFLADAGFNVKVGMRMNPDGSSTVFTRETPEEDWSELVKFAFEDAGTSSPVGYTRDGRTLYIADSSRGDTAALFAFTKDEAGTRYDEVASNPRADFADVLIDPRTGRAQAVAFEYARKEWQILDPAIEGDWKTLSETLTGDLEITSRDDADRRWVVASLRDDGPVEFHLWDRNTRKATFLFTNRPALEKLPLAKMQPHVISSRDGLSLVSYLTTPVDRPARGLPMVLLVHGGPWARDSWGLNGMHQWLANRGYAVLSVNFRGSTGFGKSFLNAGNREWAGKMHDDLIDAVNWAVSEGIADPARVAIMGGSYGGYATLVGLTVTPDVFAAGVDIVGPSHVATLLKTIPPYWAPMKSLFETRVGSLDEPEYLDSISPLTMVDRIKRPLLIGQGRNDPRVKESEAIQIVEAMKARSIPVTYVVFPDEGHGFQRPENRLAFFAVTEAFLAQHLGGQYEPIGNDLKKSTAEVPVGGELVPGVKE
mgnify:CR=1 FL=1